MPTCPQCNAFLEPVDYANGDCPNCREQPPSAQIPPPSNGDDWRSAAKVANLAEAGYLVSCLEDDGIAARLVQSESFSAVTGAWSSSYVLQVPGESFAKATELLRYESEQVRGEEPDYDEFGEPIQDEPVHLVIWRPVALMAVAGLATLWLGQRMADPRPRLAPNRSAAALGAAIEAIGQPLVVKSDAGETQHRLRYRGNSRTWYLESDTDGDGRLDRQQQFVLEDGQ